VTEEPPLGRALLAALGWAVVWPIAAIALAFELARLLTPDALQSRFFYMWTFGRSAFWFMPGFVVGAAFVLAEARWRGARSRDTSGAGWKALLLGAGLGLILGLGLGAISMMDGDRDGLDLLTLAFTTTVAASCGLATFLLDRLGVRLVAWWRRRAT
jgi:uncharacterized membrane-anchored protein YitT (DUF2179 family)